MKSPLPLVVTREYVMFQNERTRATVGLGTERGKIVVLTVGETADEIKVRWKSIVVTGDLTDVPRLVLPGEDPWWDARLHSDLFGRDEPTAHNSFLFIEPLRRETWSTEIVDVLLRYVLQLGRPWALRAPLIALELSRDFSDSEFADIVDAVRRNAGSRVHLPPERPQERVTLRRVVARAVLPLAWIVGLASLAILILSEPAPRRIKVAFAIGTLASVALFRLGRFLRVTSRFQPKARTLPN